MQHIGLLWDSVTNNMGDLAIGLVLQRALARSRIPYRVINPFKPDLADVRALVIGGGELLRPAGDPFYDVFRVPGRHILNTVGVLDGADTDYLDDYRLVSVRTHADRARLGRGEVVPCLSLLYGDTIPQEDGFPDIPPGAIGININFRLLKKIAPLAEWLRRSGLGPVVWLPVTHYNRDALMLRELAAFVPHSILLPPLSADRAFQVMGRLSGLVSCSLHAALFAYARGVPVLGFERIGKVAAFLRERDQTQALWTSVGDIQRELPRLLDRPPDLAGWRQTDEADCRGWVAQLLSEIDAILSAPSDRQALRLRPASALYYGLEMRFYALAGSLAALAAHGILQDAASLHSRLARLLSSSAIWLATTLIYPVAVSLIGLRSRLMSRRARTTRP